MTLKEVVLGMVARKELTADQAMQLIRNVRQERASRPAEWRPVAVVGMAGRFPGAADVGEFWRNLQRGVCSIAEVPKSRWEASRYYDPEGLKPGKTYCKWGGFLDGVDDFDSAFFGISPKEAQVMDPQQRLFLETSWHALEDAAYSPQRLDGVNCGVFVGVGAGDYVHQMAAEGMAADGYSFMGNANSILAARISYLLNLKGPSLSVDTACSSSLTAIHLACESLALGTSQVAIAGGICVLNTPGFFLAGSNAGMLSRRGECRAFDRDADGLVPGEAVAALVFKPLDRALADGDRIYGVIEGAAVNQDGRTNGITAPSAPSQTALELEAYRRAGVSPEQIGYVEAHGTGTRLGDPIEVEALSAAFRQYTARTGFCAIGSSKTNIGHTMSASGAVGLIKTLLMLRHGQIAPSLRFDRENEAIGFAATPFHVPVKLQDWRSDGPRRAAVSSFGFSGTNVHMVVAEAPAGARNASDGDYPIVLSAKSASALQRRVRDLAHWLESEGQSVALDSVAYTLIQGRAHFEHRAAFVASDVRELAAQLRGGTARSNDIAAAYMRGEAVSWSSARPAPVSLPGYPFERRSYRLGESSKPRRLEGTHPLLDEATASGFATTFDRNLPFLRDHVVGGEHILPGACFLEMALAGAPGDGRRLRIEEAVFRAPLAVGDAARRVELRFAAGRFEIAGEHVFCSGSVIEREAREPQRLDVDDLRRRCGREVEVGRIEEAFRAAGVVCGPFCGGLARLWIGEGAALAELRLPAGECRSLHYYRLHPTLADGAFQAAMALVSMGEATGSVLVPFRVGAVECDAAPPERCYAFVQRQAGPRYAFDIALIDDEGRVVASMRDFEARAFSRAVERVPLYRPVWRKSEAAEVVAPAGERALVLAFPESRAWAETLADSREALVALLEDRSEPVGPGVVRVDARSQSEVDAFVASLKPAGEIWFVASGHDRDPLVFLRVLKALKGPAHLRVVTHGAYSTNAAAAAVAGMALSFSREQPLIRVSLIDREHEGYTRVLEPVHAVDSAGPVIRTNGSYVIVGGAGGLGLALAHHLSVKYSAHVLLLGRSEPGASARRQIEQMAGVSYERADVTDRESLAGALARARGRCGAIHGVIHAGMVLRDVTVAGMSERALVEVLAPKIEGSRVLAELLRDDELDFLAFFSSANAFFGNAGQANYAAASMGQDAVARTVAAEGRWPVKLINWGLWGEVGAVATAQHRENAARHGIGAMTVAEGIDAFERVLRSAEMQLMPMKVTVAALNALGILASEGAPAIGDEFEAVERYGRELLWRWIDRSGALAERRSLVSLREQLRVAPRYHRLFDALIDILARHGVIRLEAGDIVRDHISPGPAEPPAASGWAAHFVRLLDVCLARYPEILSGKLAATDVLFPGGSMDLVAPLYRDNPIVEHYNRLVAAEVVERVRRGGPMRIVEVGAGTGGTTAGILEALGDSAPGVQYDFTDLSPAFLQQAKSRFAARYPFVRFALLDIDREPASQGFAAGSADIVIASNVLHATRRIDATARHVRQLLKPGGALILNEATRLHDFSTLTFGLTDGWWLSADPERRLPYSPLLDAERWRAVLRDAGFTTVECKEEGSSQTVFVAAAAAAAVTATPARLESVIAAQAARRLNLSSSEIDVNRRFAEYGVDSILGGDLVRGLNETLGVSLRATILFDYPSVRQLADYLRSDPETASIVANAGAPSASVDDLFGARISPEPSTPQKDARIAVVGMAGRFPDAPDVAAFWRNLREGKCSIGKVPRERWNVDEYYDPTPGTPGKSPCKWGGFLSDIDCFDPMFFQMSGAEAEFTDPQQRLFLEEAWKALEDAGYPDRWLDRRKCGVFVGVGAGDYVHAMAAGGLGPEPYAFLGNGVSILASRISYLLNLKGPAVAIDTACSSSAMAIHLACQSIRAGECELAVAGGVFVSTTSSFHFMTGKLGMLSPTGQCRAFDDGADGFVPGEAVGAIVLRPLDAALRDGDHVYGVILASGANQDGHTNGITAPSSVSQADLEAEVYAKAGVHPETITCVEAHGTGTRLGDPIEVEGLRQAFRRETAKTGFCALGSVKTNIGHAGPAAGVASAVKVLLALRAGQLPPSLHYDAANRNIDFAGSPFFVNRELREWASGGAPRRAAISSFGLSGTNVHLLLEEPPALPPRMPAAARPRVFVLSAKTPEALTARAEQLAGWLQAEGRDQRLGDIAFTLATGRSHFGVRAAIVASTREELIRKLTDAVANPENEVARKYVAGDDPDWDEVFAGDDVRRIPLPAYPFARERYWLPIPQMAAKSTQRIQYFRPEWIRAEPAPATPSPGRHVVWSPNLNLCEVSGAERLDFVIPAQPDLDAYFRIAAAIVRELRWRRVRVVAIAPPGELECIAALARPLAVLHPGLSWTTAIGATIEQAVRELPRGAADVRYVSGVREQRSIVPFEPESRLPVSIRRGGVYWITGGNGALGRALARYLTEKYEAQVVLTSRSAGLSADVTDLDQMRAAAAEIRRKYGRIHGVIHAAGIIDAGLLHEKPLSDIHKVLAPKIAGTRVLDEVTQDDPLDFMALFSSLSAVVGDFGQGDYSVANRRLETFAEARNRQVAAKTRHGHTVAVHWPLWAEGGMRFSRDVEEQYLRAAGMEALETAAGFQALERCLAAGVDAVALAAGDPERIRQLIGEPVIRTIAPAQAAQNMQPVVAAHIREITARTVKLSAAKLPLDGCFSNFGLDSVNMKSLADALSQEYVLPLSPTLFFQHQTANAFARYLCDEHAEAVATRHRQELPAAPVATPASVAYVPAVEPPTTGGAIAIIGMSGRFPQSADLGEYWQHLDNGDDLITDVPAERWDWKTWRAASGREEDKAVSHRGGFMPDLDKFDAAFFAISPREAAFMDPQHRIFLETVWATIEDAGYRASSLAGRKIGVYVGCQFNEYMGLIGDAGPAGAQAALGNTHTMLANRVSFLLDFRGPSEAVDTACSSALVALHRAVRSIQNGDCEMAIAGGVSAILSPETLVLSTQLGMLSPDGRCKTFDKSANGYVKGEGVGAVLLKPLDRAIADGDHIHAVIRGTAENHGGRANFLTAPNPDAQAQLLIDAYTRSGIDVRTVSYIEAHGTGTELGDPMEVDALNRAFSRLGGAVSDAPYCGLGSVKSNIGHLEPAAGIAGLLKVVLAMQHGRIPRTLHVHEVNPYLKLAGSPFYLAVDARPWDASPKRAGVSSFGFGGSNAHAILEESPLAPRTAAVAGRVHIVPLSARTGDALREIVERLSAALRSSTRDWDDVAFTLQTGREPMEHRLAIEAAGVDDLVAKLERWLAGADTPAVYRGEAGRTLDELGLFDTPGDLADFVRNELSKGKLAKVARLWCAGAEVDWSALHLGIRRVPLPTYPFARVRHWFDRRPQQPAVEAPALPASAAVPAGIPDDVVEKLKAMFADALYLEPSAIDIDASFADLGLDSILAVELAKKMNDEFGAPVKATRLYDYTTIRALAGYLGGDTPQEPPVAAASAPAAPQESTRTILIALLADALYLEPSQIDENATFTDLGLDSILAVELARKLQDRFGIDLRATRLYDHSTVRELADYVDSSTARPLPAPPKAPAEPAAKAASPPASADRLRNLVAAVLSVAATDIDDNLDLLELGMDAVSAQELSRRIRQEFGVTIAGPRLLSVSSAHALAREIEALPQDAVAPPPALEPARPVVPEAIAIVGMSGRFPGACNLDEFWANLAGGVDSTTEVPADRWPIAQYFDATPGAPGKTYCRRGGFLADIDRFDPLFFQISPQEAECMDPQQRLFLEQAWLAFEDAGYSEQRLASVNCAVFAGASQGDYFRHVDPSSAAASQFTLGNTNAILASRIAYYLNLKGPAVSVDTACSSALVALHLACQALRSGECEIALAGGVSVMTTPTMYLLGSQGRMLSSDGRCKSFAADADGFAPSEGVGVVVLKPLAAARRDGDRVLAVIRGSGINQDGKTNGITAPSAQSQAALETALYERFGLDPSTFSYVEAHGTGTTLGDPIEVDALTTAFRRHTDRKQFCAIGSVKSNIGHCLPAAGMAGLIKTVLALCNSQLPPTLHCRSENGHIDFANSPFFVNRELSPWPADPETPRRAAISSFGFSGTNAHVVIEEASRQAIRPVPDTAKPRAFCLSAKTADSLKQRVHDLEQWLNDDAGQSALDDISYTLNLRRSHFRHRVAIVASTRKELMEQLRQLRESGVPSAIPSSANPVEASAREWMAGGSPDWAPVYRGANVSLLSLPQYPFARRRCWVSSPAPQPAVGLLAGAAEILRDHMVQGKPVLPAVAYLEMARASSGAAELRNVVWKAPCEAATASPELELVFRDRAFDFVRAGVTHASGETAASLPIAPTVEPRWQTSSWREFGADQVYAAFDRLGLTYGPSFRRLEWIRVDGRTAVGRIAPAAAQSPYRIHPGILDASLQAVIGFALIDGPGGDPVLPFALDRYCVYAPVDAPCYSQVTIDPDRGRFDVRIVDENGNVLVVMEGLASRARKAPATTLLELQPVWREAPINETKRTTAGAIVVFRGAEDFGLSAALSAAHAGATVIPIFLGSQFAASPTGHPLQVNCGSEVDFERALLHAPSITRIYFLGLAKQPATTPLAIDSFQESAVLALFRLARTVARQDLRPDFIVVTNNVHRISPDDTIHPQAATLSGFTRVLAGEFPTIPTAVVDVDSAGVPQDLARALAAEHHSAGERALPEIAYRHGVRYRRDLEPLPAASTAPTVREGGVYVILGGMGGLGSVFARHLAATKRARLLLVGRGPLTPERQQRLRDLEMLGGEAVYCAADICDPQQIERVRAEAIARWGHVHGVIDAAFLLRDQSLLRMDEERFREGLDPKVRGTAAALWAFRGDPLDWFALFSSSISFTGSPGQSNYAAGSTFQDAIGLAWNALGNWPVRVLNWGFWGDVGAVASDSYRRRATALGVASITPAEGIAAFYRALAGDAPQCVVLKMAAEARPPLEPRRAITAPPTSVVAYLRGVVSTILKVNDDELDNDRPFEDYGVDSLVSINVLSRIEEDLGPLSKTLLFEHDTIAKLAAHVAERHPDIFTKPTTTPAGIALPSTALLKVRESGSEQKSFWVHSVVGEMNWAVRLAHHMGPEWPVYGFQADGRSRTLEDMAAAYLHSVRAIQPHGPYILGGLSFGGSVALEMARQLEEVGETVSWLVLLDAYAPGSAALHSLMQFNWDGLLPQVIANSLVRQWQGSKFLDASMLPKNDPEAQIRVAARHVCSVCKIPQTEDEIAAIMANSARLANLHAELQRDYRARPVRNVENAIVFRNRFGFVGPANGLGLSETTVNDGEADHGWAQWLRVAPRVETVDADHFSLPLDPAIGVVGRRIAELFAGAPVPDRRRRVFDVVKSQVLRILPDVPPDAITLEVRLKDIGANSLDRVEVATCAMEELQVDVPRTRLAQVDSLESLVDVLLSGLSEGRNGH